MVSQRTDPKMIQQHASADVYVVTRTKGRGIQFVPSAKTGPGKTARSSFVFGIILGLLSVGLWTLLNIYLMRHGNALGWVRWLMSSGLFLVRGCARIGSSDQTLDQSKYAVVGRTVWRGSIRTPRAGRAWYIEKCSP